MKYLIFLGSLILGFALIYYCKWITEHSGLRISYVERNLGGGGMYTFWKLLGLVFILLAFYVLFGE